MTHAELEDAVGKLQLKLPESVFGIGYYLMKALDTKSKRRKYKRYLKISIVVTAGSALLWFILLHEITIPALVAGGAITLFSLYIYDCVRDREAKPTEQYPNLLISPVLIELIKHQNRHNLIVTWCIDHLHASSVLEEDEQRIVREAIEEVLPLLTASYANWQELINWCDKSHQIQSSSYPQLSKILRRELPTQEDIYRRTGNKLNALQEHLGAMSRTLEKAGMTPVERLIQQ